MTTDQARKTAANAVGRLLAEEVGGCFNSEDDTLGECADGDCYCSKRARSIADVSIDAYLYSSTEDGGEREIRERHRADGLREKLRSAIFNALASETDANTQGVLVAVMGELEKEQVGELKYKFKVAEDCATYWAERHGEARQEIATLQSDLEQMRKVLLECIEAMVAVRKSYRPLNGTRGAWYLGLVDAISHARALTQVPSHTGEG